MERLPKQKRAVYSKSFSVKNILENLQSYRLASGGVKPSELQQAQKHFGSDEGKVYGALLTGTMVTTEGGEDSRRTRDSGKGRRKKNKRRRKRRKIDHPPDEEANSDQESTQQDGSTEPRLPKSCDLDATVACSTSSLGLLTSYHSNSSASCESNTDSGENDNVKLKRVKSQAQPDNEKYEVPSSIQALYPESENSAHRDGDCVDSLPSTQELGFFHSYSTSDSEDGEDGEGVASGLRWDRTEEQPQLDSYLCWKCSNVGHLPQDCTVRLASSQATGNVASQSRIPSQLQRYYKRCRDIGRARGQHCIECGVHSNVVTCLDCSSVVCDGRGHLSAHLLQHPTHRTLYSHKLQRMVKCCKASCDTVDIYELFMCSCCLGKAFSQHYSLITATWSASGLRAIPNALCCEEHFQWHRMNCPTAAEEPLLTALSLSSAEQVSEFFF